MPASPGPDRPEQNPTRSTLEDDFVAWIKKHHLQAFNHDHARDAAHRAIGYDTIRYTGEQLSDDEAVNLERRLDG